MLLFASFAYMHSEKCLVFEISTFPLRGLRQGFLNNIQAGRRAGLAEKGITPWKA